MREEKKMVLLREGFTSTTTLLIIILAVIGYYLYNALKKNKIPFVRKIPALDAIEEVMGRSAEMGGPVQACAGSFTELMSTRYGGGSTNLTVALHVLNYTARLAARYGTKFIATCITADSVPLVDEALRTGYIAEGKMDAYDPTYSVRFLGGRKKIAETAISGILKREQCVGNIMIGAFGPGEVQAILEVGRQQGCMQVSGGVHPRALAMMAAVSDYVLFSEEFYAVGAYLSKEPRLTATIGAQDIIKMLVIAIIILGTLLINLGNSSILNFLKI